MRWSLPLIATSLACGLLIAYLGNVASRAEDPPKPMPKEKSADEPAQPPEPKQTTLAKKPKPISEHARKGIEYLIKQQQANGGWGGGPAAVTFDPKGNAKTDAIDVANTSIAALALLRTGCSPKAGPHSNNLRKAIDAVMKSVEDSDQTSLALKTASPTQVQRKIGDNVDTFMAAILLASAKGGMPDAASEERLEKALRKIVNKMEANQKEDGTWNGQGWAPVLSQALASRAINMAKQAGMAVDNEKIEKTAKHARDSFKQFAEGLGSATKPATGKAAKGAPALGVRGTGPFSGTAGVDLYGAAAAISAMQDAVNTHRLLGSNSQNVLRSSKTNDRDRAEAKLQLSRLDAHEKDLKDALRVMAKKAGDANFTRGFGSDGGEEFLSFMLIGEALLSNQMREFTEWDKTLTNRLVNSQNGTGSWAGKHCISGETFCTASAVMALTVDRAPRAVGSELAHSSPPSTTTSPKPADTPSNGEVTRSDLPDPNSAGPAVVGEPERLVRELLNGGDRDALLLKLRDTKGGDYTDALAQAAAKLEGDDQKEARNALAARLTRMTAKTLRNLMGDSDRELRRAAALACAMKEDKSHVPDLIALLNDTDVLVLRASRAALKSLSGGQDFGPEPDADGADKAKAILDWKNWWNRQGANR